MNSGCDLRLLRTVVLSYVLCPHISHSQVSHYFCPRHTWAPSCTYHFLFTLLAAFQPLQLLCCYYLYCLQDSQHMNCPTYLYLLGCGPYLMDQLTLSSSACSSYIKSLPFSYTPKYNIFLQVSQPDLPPSHTHITNTSPTAFQSLPYLTQLGP